MTYAIENKHQLSRQEAARSRARILFLVNGVIDSYKAYTQNFLYLVNTSQEMHYEITLSGLRKGDISQNNFRITKSIIHKKSLLGLCKLVVSNLIELLRHEYDIVIIGSLYTPTLILYNLVTKIRRPRKIVYYMQDPVPESFRLAHKMNSITGKLVYSLEVLAEKIACNMSDTIIVPSRSTLKIIQERNNLNGKQVIYGYNSLGLRKLKRELTPTEIESVKNKFRLGKGPVILYSGKIQENIRGIEQQFRAIRKLTVKYPDTVFLLTGSGATSKLKEEAKRLQIDNNVIFTEVLSEQELKAVYALSDMMIMPPVSFLLPTKFFEAIYMGLVLVVAKCSSDMIDILGDEAVTYDGSDDELTRVLTQIVENLEFYKARASNIKNRALDYVDAAEKGLEHALLLKYDSEKTSC